MHSKIKVLFVLITILIPCSVYAETSQEIFSAVGKISGEYRCKNPAPYDGSDCIIQLDRFGGSTFGCSLEKPQIISEIRKGKCKFIPDNNEYYECTNQNNTTCRVLISPEGYGYSDCNMGLSLKEMVDTPYAIKARMYLKKAKCKKKF